MFSKKLKVTLAPKAKCSFLAQGDAMLDWEPFDNFMGDPLIPNPVWTYVLNYTGEPCELYGGDTLE